MKKKEGLGGHGKGQTRENYQEARGKVSIEVKRGKSRDHSVGSVPKHPSRIKPFSKPSTKVKNNGPGHGFAPAGLHFPLTKNSELEKRVDLNKKKRVGGGHANKSQLDGVPGGGGSPRCVFVVNGSDKKNVFLQPAKGGGLQVKMSLTGNPARRGCGEKNPRIDCDDSRSKRGLLFSNRSPD